MAVMSIRIDDKKRRALKVLASAQGKTMGGILSELIDEYIDLRLSKKSFDEWDNEEDEVYNEL